MDGEEVDQYLSQIPKNIVRPMVDPEAEGNVDPNLYPEPKEATHKIRGKNDFIEYFFGAIDQELLTVKTFYFFFYSAFGSLFPLMGVYFKQMGMNAGQCGLLIGLRPFIEFFSAPFWGSWADRLQKGKIILLASLACWILFTLPLGFIQPPPTSCMIYKNHTNYLDVPDSEKKVVKRFSNYDQDFIVYKDYFNSTKKTIKKTNFLKNNTRNSFKIQKKLFPAMEQLVEMNKNRKKKNFSHLKAASNIKDLIKKKQSHKFFKNIIVKNLLIQINASEDDTIFKQIQNSTTFDIQNESTDTIVNPMDQKLSSQSIIPIHIQRHRRNVKMLLSSAGQSPLSVSDAKNYEEKKHKEWVKPVFSSIVYRLSDIQKTFFLLLLMVIVGEFFSAPAITLADSAVITLLGDDADRYGHQRMFGSLGWGLAMFFVGIALDHSTAFPEHPCGPDDKEKNYTICFAIFSVLMGAALITATQINFKYNPVVSEPHIEKTFIEPTREEQLQSQLSQQLNLPSLQETLSVNTNLKTQPPEGKTKMFAQTTREIPEWLTVLKQFKDIKCASFLFVAWFMGFGIGLIFTFLFWHLQDYGGTPTLFGVASVINHISEIFAYFFSFKLIREIGHVKVLCLGLGGNVLRFLYISWLKNPWWVLPFEFIQGITHAAVWAACCSYIAHNTPLPLRSSAQGVLQGLHHGLGRGCGAVIGGIFVAMYGTTIIFRAYGLICLLVLTAFIFINFYQKDHGFVSNLSQTEDPHQVAEVTHLAPHGVPSNAVPRALSSHRLHELVNQDSSYGATYTAGNHLYIPQESEVLPSTNNPFLRHSIAKYGETTCESGNEEFIRKSFQDYNEIISTDLNMKALPIMTHLDTQQPCTNPFHQHNYEW